MKLKEENFDPSEILNALANKVYLNIHNKRLINNKHTINA